MNGMRLSLPHGNTTGVHGKPPIKNIIIIIANNRRACVVHVRVSYAVSAL